MIRGKHPFEALIDFHFRNIDSYLADVTVELSNGQKRLDEFLAKEIEREPLNTNSVLDVFQEEIARYSELYFSLTRNSTIVTCYSKFEMLLKRLCLYAKDALELPHPLPSNKANLKDFKSYLEKKVKLDLSSLDKEWKRIDSYRVVRNLIVHNNNNVVLDRRKSVSSQDDYNLVSDPACFKVDEETGDFAIINPAYVFGFSDVAKRYLVDCFRTLNAKVQTRVE